MLVTQSCPTLCNPRHCSPPGSSQHMEFSRQEYWSVLPFPPPGESSQARGKAQVSCIAGGFFTVWANTEAQTFMEHLLYLSAYCARNRGNKIKHGRIHTNNWLQNPVIGASIEPDGSLESSYAQRRESSTLLCGGAGRCSRSFTDRCLSRLWKMSRVLGYPKGVKRPFKKKIDCRQRHGDIKWCGLFWIPAKLFILVGKRKESVGGVWRGNDD